MITIVFSCKYLKRQEISSEKNLSKQNDPSRYFFNLEEYGSRVLEWKSDKNETEFYSCLNNNLSSYYFSINKDIIDFDLLKYLSLDFISENEVKVKCIIRKVYYNNMIMTMYNTYDITLKYNGEFDSKDYKIITCSGCGASIDAKDNVCEYCCKKIETSSWSIVEMNKILN